MVDHSKNQGYGGYDKDELDNDSLNLYRQGIACFKGNAPCYHLELRDTTRMVWDFHSLMLAIKFLFSLSLSNGTIPLRICSQCSRAFVARRSDMQFCSDVCRGKYQKEKKTEWKTVVWRLPKIHIFRQCSPSEGKIEHGWDKCTCA